MEIFKEANKLTDKQKKRKVIDFLNNGDNDKVLSWVENCIDIYEEMNYRMREWDDNIYGEEYDHLIELGYINED